MGKMVGLAEFKANCLKLIAEVQKTGEPITLTKRGEAVAQLQPIAAKSRSEALFGILKGTVTFAPNFQPDESALDPDWEEKWDAQWDEFLPSSERHSRS